MSLKRKPPPGNVRRVASIGGNLRYTITSKADQTIQCESFLERVLTPTVGTPIMDSFERGFQSQFLSS